jgi:hypothetical protein
VLLDPRFPEDIDGVTDGLFGLDLVSFTSAVLVERVAGRDLFGEILERYPEPELVSDDPRVL